MGLEDGHVVRFATVVLLSGCGSCVTHHPGHGVQRHAHVHVLLTEGPAASPQVEGHARIGRHLRPELGQAVGCEVTVPAFVDVLDFRGLLR